MLINFFNIDSNNNNIFEICRKQSIKYAGVLLYKINYNEQKDCINNKYIYSMLEDGISELSDAIASFAFFSFIDKKLDYSKINVGNITKEYYQSYDSYNLDLIMEWLGTVFGVGGRYPTFVLINIASKKLIKFDLTTIPEERLYEYISDIYFQLYELAIIKKKDPKDVFARLSSNVRKIDVLPNTHITIEIRMF